MMVHHNRKSHLIQPQDSPSASELPRINGSSSSGGYTSQAQTPTLGDMDQQMSGLSIGVSAPPQQQQDAGRPYPVRTSSATNMHRSIPTQPGYQRAPPSGPLPHLPRKEGQHF